MAAVDDSGARLGGNGVIAQAPGRPGRTWRAATAATPTRLPQTTAVGAGLVRAHSLLERARSLATEGDFSAAADAYVCVETALHSIAATAADNPTLRASWTQFWGALRHERELVAAWQAECAELTSWVSEQVGDRAGQRRPAHHPLAFNHGSAVHLAFIWPPRLCGPCAGCVDAQELLPQRQRPRQRRSSRAAAHTADRLQRRPTLVCGAGAACPTQHPTGGRSGAARPRRLDAP